MNAAYLANGALRVNCKNPLETGDDEEAVFAGLKFLSKECFFTVG
jgi:hypothetical protein